MSEAKSVIEKSDSVKISINAKSCWSAEIKVYSDSVDDAMVKALVKAKEMEALIKEKNGL